MKAIVKASSFYRVSGNPVGDGITRDELIDTETNVLFKMCRTVLDIKNAYESFWNELNPHSEHLVFVHQIILIDQEST
jgi:hypothetical protein